MRRTKTWMTTLTTVIALAGFALLFSSAALAVSPPDSINFQGVLRDASGAPLDGSYDMVFSFHDSLTAGNVIMYDEHLASGTGAVIVTDGLFNASLGSGNTVDGGSFGTSYTTVSALFQSFTNVWLEIEVGGETLSPRVYLRSATHALNAGTADFAGDATRLGGVLFEDYLRADVSDVSAGRITAQELATSTDLFVNPGGPDDDGFIYFHDGGSDTARYLRWDSIGDRFRLNDELIVEGQLHANEPVRVNADGPEGDGIVYFWDGGVYFGEWLRWDDSANAFATSNDINVNGNIKVNAGGPDQSSYLFFYDGGSPTAEFLQWDNASNGFFASSSFSAVGDLATLNQQIVINDDGPNMNQEIEFFNGVTQAERFQWDAAALRFEVSDDFHAFGTISASVKNFVQNHPYRDDLEIVYTSLEGNEVTTFTRGAGRLAGGEARIALEESFRYVTNPDLGLSAHLTPRGAAADLYVASLTTEELVVRSAGGGDVAFDFIVYGLRIGYEDHPVYRPKRAESFVPPVGHFDADLAASEGLSAHTALSRYRRTEEIVNGQTGMQMEAALALREAIGMREQGLDFPRGSLVSVRDMNRAELAKRGSGAEEFTGRQVARPPAGNRSGAEGTPESERADRAITTGAVDAAGDVYARSFRPSAGDIARMVSVGETVEAGDVLVIDAHARHGLALSRAEGDPAVFGVVAAEPGVVLGSSATSEADSGDREVPVAFGGIVLCKVDASWGAIEPGDLLQTSPTPGHAMRADAPRVGSVLGKALDRLDHGTGTIRVLVTLR